MLLTLIPLNRPQATCFYGGHGPSVGHGRLVWTQTPQYLFVLSGKAQPNDYKRDCAPVIAVLCDAREATVVQGVAVLGASCMSGAIYPQTIKATVNCGAFC